MDKPGFWDESLIELQRQYWQRWSEISAVASGGKASKTPWELAQEHWWQALAPAAPASGRAFMERMMEQGAQLFRMAEMFSFADEGQKHPWQEIVDDLSSQMNTAAACGSTGASDQLQRLMGFWSTPLQGWQRMAAGLSFTSPESDDNPFSLQRMLKMPGFGVTREEQAQQQRLAQLVGEYQQALQAYNRFFADIGSEAAKRLRERLEQLQRVGEAVESARALYDLWVDSCETVYGERVAEGDFSRINGELVNSSLRVKQQLGRMADEYLGGLNMPTRRELRTLQQRLHENRRENRRLREEIDALKSHLSQPAARPAATKKRVSTSKRAPQSSVKKVATKSRVAVKKAT
ncbi:MAG: class III poly(R)-hydroxyalkanoic acid synthase subunit PhaE [Gammaproteobacteria bacterium]|nr:class III poly(R)-hydroxyalkanoic acid synthase subunit PhaE [Gammaproteobacteria bacterium]